MTSLAFASLANARSPLIQLGGLEQYVHGVAQAMKQYIHKIITAWIQVYIRMYIVNDKS